MKQLKIAVLAIGALLLAMSSGASNNQWRQDQDNAVGLSAQTSVDEAPILGIGRGWGIQFDTDGFTWGDPEPVATDEVASR